MTTQPNKTDEERFQDWLKTLLTDADIEYLKEDFAPSPYWSPSYKNGKPKLFEAFIAGIESGRARSRELIAEIREGYNCIRTTGYSEENGKRCMDGNEYPWIDRGLKMIKDALVEYHGSDKKDEV